MSDISDEDCVVIEQIYVEYCQFEESKGRIPVDRTEWAKTMIEVGDKLGDPYFIKNLIERYKMKKNYGLN